jgi:guanylate kinase
MYVPILCIGGPSGVGKTTIINKMVEAYPDMGVVVSVTTRPPRPGEVNGKHYYFVDKQNFDQEDREGLYCETTSIYNNHYASYLRDFLNFKDQGRDVILPVDLSGYQQIKQRFPKEVVGVWLVPKDLDRTSKRLRDRSSMDSSMTEERILNRIKSMEEEIANARFVNFIIEVDEDHYPKVFTDMKDVYEYQKNKVSGFNPVLA